jgi:hypothetical protein
VLRSLVVLTIGGQIIVVPSYLLIRWGLNKSTPNLLCEQIIVKVFVVIEQTIDGHPGD